MKDMEAIIDIMIHRDMVGIHQQILIFILVITVDKKNDSFYFSFLVIFILK